jgi:hypothetical protein
VLRSQAPTMPIQLHPFVFDPSTATWVEDRAEPAATAPQAALTVVTWNTWFAPYSFEPRFRALLEQIHAQHRT